MADETKNDTKTGAWHYIDLALQDHKSNIPERCKDDNCAPARIRMFAEQLAGHPAHPGNTSWSQLDALRYLVHLVGDIHQPLHTISDADLGGNCELLDPPVGKAKNLHALWDGGIIDQINTSSSASSLSLVCQEFAGLLAQEFPRILIATDERLRGVCHFPAYTSIKADIAGRYQNPSAEEVEGLWGGLTPRI